MDISAFKQQVARDWAGVGIVVTALGIVVNRLAAFIR